MASFTEQAILDVVDKATPDINKINAELKKLFKTAKQLQGLSGRGKPLGIDVSNLSRAQARVRSLTQEIARMQAQATRRTSVNLSVPRTQGILGTRGADLWGRTAGTALGLAIHGAIRGIGREIGEAIRVGGRAQDIAETRLDLLGLTKPERTEVDQAINFVVDRQRAQKGGPTFNRQQVEQIMAESIPGLVGDKGKLNVEGARFMTEQAASLIELQIATGIEAKQAIARAQDFIKAGISSQRIFDPATGLFSEALATNFFNQMRRLAPVIGEEFTGPFVRNMLQNAPRLKGTLTDPALDKILMQAEEDRSRIFTGLETLRNTLFDIDISKMSQQGKALIAAGIRVPEGKKSTAGVEQLKAEFTKDPYSIADDVINYMRSVGLDPSKREDVSLAVGRMVRTARAGGALETLVNTAQEMNNQFAFLDRSTGSVAETQERLAGSLLLSQAKLENAFQGLAGQAVRLVEPILIPAMDAVTRNLSALAEGKVPDPAAIAATTASMIAASAIAIPFGGLAGLTALTTGQGNTSQLLGAIAVNTAATAANTSGLGVDGKKGGWKDVFSNLPGPLGKAFSAAFALDALIPEIHYLTEAERQALIEQKKAASFIEQAIQLATMSPVTADVNAKSTSAQKEAFRALYGERYAKKGKAQREAEDEYGGKEGIKALQAKVGAFVDGLFGPQTLDRLKRYETELRAVEETNRRKVMEAATKPPSAADALTRQDWADLDRVARDIADVRQRMELVMTPKPGEGATAGTFEKQDRLPIPLPVIIQNLKQPTPDRFGPYVPGAPQIYTPNEPERVSRLLDRDLDGIINEGANQIASVFGTGASEIATSVTTASASIQTGMVSGGTSAGQTIAAFGPQFGASAGNAIAVAMRNAAASVTVNVNQQAAAPDAGAMPTPG